MKKRPLKISGAFLTILGAFLLIIQPINLITGAVIDSSTSISVIDFIIGLSMMIVGIILYSTATVEERVTQNIIYSDRFRREIKRVDPRILRRAIEKIGKGLADEKHLHEYAGGGYQIRTDKGGRIHYKRTYSGEIILTDYVPSSEHR